MTASMGTSSMAARQLPAAHLARRCDPATLGISTSGELAELDEVVGQEGAIEAAQLATGTRRPGFNLVVLGRDGSGRRTLARRFLERQAADESVPEDLCYVNNFSDPQRPRALRLPAGTGRRLRHDMERLVVEFGGALQAAFESERFQSMRKALEERLQRRRDEALAAFEKRAAQQGLRLLRTPFGIGLIPMRDDKVLGPSELEALAAEDRERLRGGLAQFQQELEEAIGQFPIWEREHRRELRRLARQVTHDAVVHLIAELREAYRDLAAVQSYLDQVQADIEENAGELLDRPDSGETADHAPRADGAPVVAEGQPRLRRYAVNVLVDHTETRGAPVVVEDHPTYANLTGRIEHASVQGALITDFTLIRPGALHRANGGYLILELRRLLEQPYAWEALKRALLSGELRMESLANSLGLITTTTLEPEPLKLDVKVALIGDRYLYYLLARFDPQLRDLFKIEADFEDEIERDERRSLALARLLATIARREAIRPLSAAALAGLIDQAARRAGDARKLAADLRYLVDLMREADYWAAREAQATIELPQIEQAATARRRRAGRTQRLLLEAIRRRTLLIATHGRAIGQVNALTVARISDETFGWPTRVTARVRLGRGEVVDIEREVELGGPIHSKGVLILVGFLGQRYAQRLPLSLHASLVFEQSYAGVEGDSASLGELCALLSAIGDLPLAQGIAVTGSVDQQGNVQAVGAVNEKIEGFFDACLARRRGGRQGVIIPAANVENLMLRADVVQAAESGRFNIYAVRTIDQAMELLSGRAAGTPDRRGNYPRASVNGRVQRRLNEFASHLRVVAGRSDGVGLPVSVADDGGGHGF
jgi:predicted ATP-dependent protease